MAKQLTEHPELAELLGGGESCQICRIVKSAKLTIFYSFCQTFGKPIHLQKSVSIHPRTSPPTIGEICEHFAKLKVNLGLELLARWMRLYAEHRQFVTRPLVDHPGPMDFKICTLMGKKQGQKRFQIRVRESFCFCQSWQTFFFFF